MSLASTVVDATTPPGMNILDVRSWINETLVDRHLDGKRMPFETLRMVAHDVVDKILAGDRAGAELGLSRMGASAENLRFKLVQQGLLAKEKK